jgi:hypothetical protein
MTLTPGYGTETFHLRESADRLRQLFGPPSERRKTGSFREYWLYPNDHLDCIVSKKSGMVLSLFLHRGNPLIGLDEFDVTEANLRKIYGLPAQEGGGFRISTGDYVNRWLNYDRGIGFDFDAENRLQTISIFAPKQKATARRVQKPAASHGQVHTRRIAALRAR